MWILFRRVPNVIMADMWKELLESEGVPMRILVAPDEAGMGDAAARLIYIPEQKSHVAAEALRKI
ncbi:MAG: hypothetical protein HYU86_03940 [Chloroflexi bacterium]|nr:hypothetical protein [Chloroflexota bacterium]